MGGFSVFESLRPRLLMRARAMLRGSALGIEPEDLVQTTLAKVLARVEEDADIPHPEAYAYIALKRQFFDELRRARHRFETAMPQVGEDGMWEPPDPRGADPERLAVMRDRLRALSERLDQLSDPERRFVLALIVDDLPVTAAQRACGWPPKSAHYHAKRLLAFVRGAGDSGDDE